MKNLILGIAVLCQTTLMAQDLSLSLLGLSPDLKENANSVMRLDALDMEIHSSNRVTYTSRVVTTILNKKGMRGLRTSIGYDPNTKVKSADIYIYDALGKQQEHIRKKSFADVSAVDGFSLYLDNRVLVYKYKPTSYPFTIEFTYQIETSNTGFLPQWYFIPGFNESVEKSRYSITYANTSLKPIIKEKNLELITYKKKEEGNRIVYTAENLQAEKPEAMTPSFSKLSPNLSVRLPKYNIDGFNATVSNWKELGIWMNNLLEGRQALNQATKNKVLSLVKGVDDDLEKAKIVFQFVQDNTRYVSVQIGIGGFQPISAIEVDNVKYGDCKGLSNYTRALLQTVGVESYYVHVQAGPKKIDFDPEFPDLIQGNHAILAIPYKGEYYWVDSTSQTIPFGYLGTFTDGRKVLVMKPEGGEIVTTQAYLNEDNLKETFGKCTLEKDGTILGNLVISTTGVQYRRHYWLEDQDAEEVDEYYKNFWSHINNISLEEYTFENDKDAVEFKEKVKVSVNNFANVVGDRILFSIRTFAEKASVPPRHRNRKYPMEIQRGFLDKDSYEVALPVGYSVETLPEPTKIENKFGEYSISFSAEGNLLNIERKLLIKAGEYPNTDYDLYRAFKRKISKSDKRQIALIQKTQP
ncbi:MAG: DUF3857 domain-containing protein [Bacteroidota bacterium]